MKTSLTTKLGQQLTLTPQLRQAIHLLTLSAAELESEINLALESNPLLERAEDAPVGDDGYLTETLESIRAGLLPEIHVEIDEIGTVLHRIQRFDPVGVACTNLAECLGVQLSVLSPDTQGLALARRIAAGHLESLAK